LKPRSAEKVPFSLAKSGTDKHLCFVLLGWFAFLVIAAVILSPVDSHVEPGPVTLWSIVTITALLTLYTGVAVPAYLYQSWLRLPTVPNKTAYGLWIGLESLLLLSVAAGAVYLLLNMLYGVPIHWGVRR